MPTRRLPFRKKPNDIIQSRIDAVLNGNHKIFLMQELGPTLFIVKEEYQEEVTSPQDDDGTNNNTNSRNTITKTQKYKVAIGDMQKCTCGSSDICIHILFIMLKVLRVPKNNPVVWQHSLLEREINDCLSGRYRAAQQRHRRPTVRNYLKRSSKSSCDDDNDKNNAKKRQIEEGDTCPVCLDELTNEDKELTYCKSGCGKQAHSKCMIMYAEHQKSVGKKVTCPLCRSDWGPMALYDLKTELQNNNNNNNGSSHNHPKVRCCHCPSRTELIGLNYRCLVCNDYDLCERCFRTTAVHAQHPFVCRESHSDTWKPAPRIPRRNTISNQRRRLQQATTSTSSNSATSSLIRQIQQIQQYREFNSNDYELLLRLDEENRREQRRLNALNRVNDLYEDDAAIRVPLAVYLVQCIKACYTTLNSRTRANLNYNLQNMTNSSSCVQCNGRMAGTDNPIRLICGCWIHGTCVESLIASSTLTNNNNVAVGEGVNGNDENQQNNSRTQMKYPSCPKCKQCLYPGLKPRYKKANINRNKKKKNNNSNNTSSTINGINNNNNNNSNNNNTFMIEATGINALNIGGLSNTNNNSLIHSNGRIHGRNNNNTRRRKKANTNNNNNNNRKTVLLAESSSSNNNLELNMSSQSLSATTTLSSKKRGGTIRTINNFNSRRIQNNKSRFGIRRSHSAGNNSTLFNNNRMNNDNRDDGSMIVNNNNDENNRNIDDGFALQTIPLGSSSSNNTAAVDNNNRRRQIASSSGHIRPNRRSKSRNNNNNNNNNRNSLSRNASRNNNSNINNTNNDNNLLNNHNNNSSSSGIQFGRGMLDSLISSNNNNNNNGGNNPVKKRNNGRIRRGLTFNKRNSSA